MPTVTHENLRAETERRQTAGGCSAVLTVARAAYGHRPWPASAVAGIQPWSGAVERTVSS
ncbi:MULTISPECIES: hypothetical protein [unclassified Streptomyces]|uniref:hypothetical protein n=1 Tax=unclassified Streptomyces TaxID=2593676 RepID=UPI00332E356C